MTLMTSQDLEPNHLIASPTFVPAVFAQPATVVAAVATPCPMADPTLLMPPHNLPQNPRWSSFRGAVAIGTGVSATAAGCRATTAAGRRNSDCTAALPAVRWS